MNKSTHFSGQPTFTQLVKLLPKDLVMDCIQRSDSDRYYKKFNTWHHLITMLFTCYGHCSSLREVITGMRALEGRLRGCDIKFFPPGVHFPTPTQNVTARYLRIFTIGCAPIGSVFTRTADRGEIHST
jgi:hypothetical protein